MGNNGKIVRFEKERVILREGDMSSDMYKIIKGHAELYTGYGTEREVLLGIIGPQSCFGEFGLLLHEPSIYTVIAFDEVYVLRITEGEMGDFVQENHKNIIEIMRNMSRMMMVMQHQIDMLSADIKNGRKADQELIKKTQRNLRGYAVYNSCPPVIDMDMSGSWGVMNMKV